MVAKNVIVIQPDQLIFNVILSMGNVLVGTRLKVVGVTGVWKTPVPRILEATGKRFVSLAMTAITLCLMLPTTTGPI
jgi:hypothetical protein